MRIYDGEFTVGAILEQCRTGRHQSVSSVNSLVMRERESLHTMQPTSDGYMAGIDLKELSRIVNRIPVNIIRERRQRLNTFYEEVLVSADPERGISFHMCLMILAHYNVITDSKSLRLEEFLRRRARLQRVEEAVRRNTVIGFFDTLYWSREFRRAIDRKKAGRMTAIPQFQFSVPEIHVDVPGDSEDPEQPAPGAMTPQTQHDPEGPFAPMLSPTSPAHRRTESSPAARRSDLPRLDTSLTGRSSGGSTPTEWSSISPMRTPRRMYGERVSFESNEQQESPTRDHSRQNSAMSVRDVMHSLDNSAWGESIRRSFTQRRSGGSSDRSVE